jgi:ribonuclease BN (tRNA processing enzyme)
VRLRVVGCSGNVPGPASPASCYLVEADDADRTWRIALDLGSGALGPLQRWCDPRELDAVAITHLHPDHCADLAALHVYLGHHSDGPAGPVAVLAPFGTASRLEQLRGSPGSSDRLDIRAWQSGASVGVGPFVLSPQSVDHSIPAYAIRLEGPGDDGEARVLAYSGDGDRCEGLERVADGADLLVCEATFTEAEDQPRGFHLTGRRAGALAADADARALMLTHIPPWTDPNTVLTEAESEYDGPITLARAGAEVAV